MSEASFFLFVLCLLTAIACAVIAHDSWDKLTVSGLFWVYSILGMFLIIVAVTAAFLKCLHEIPDSHWPLFYEAGYIEILGIAGIGFGLIGIADTLALTDVNQRREARKAAVESRRKVSRL